MAKCTRLTAVANASKHEKLLLTPKQMDQKKRNFMRGYHKWPKAIVPYTIDKSRIVQQRSYDIIKTAVEIFNACTCLKWLPYTPELAKKLEHDHFVKFTDTNSGCFSYLGYLPISGYEIGLEDPGCMYVGIVVHEMLHAAGFAHEQSRSDRDEYIRVLFENFDNSDLVNVMKDDTLDRNPYDYASTMQYHLDAFSKNGKPTLQFLDKDLEFLAGMGEEEGMGFYDIKDVIVNYECAAGCQDPPVCVNGGFVNHECVCYCPQGYTGKTCETVITDSDCGGLVEVPPGNDVFVISPGYPASYPPGKTCRWGVKAPKGWNIRMTVEELRLPGNSLNRCYNWLEIQYNLPGQRGIKRCGEMNGDQWTGSKDSPDFMTLTFNSGINYKTSPLQGFRLRFNAIERKDDKRSQDHI